MFEHRNHVCMVFELLAVSVFDFLKSNGFQSFPYATIQRFARQLLESVAFLHGLTLVHTDLKPENIMLVRDESVERAPAQAASKSGRRSSSKRKASGEYLFIFISL